MTAEAQIPTKVFISYSWDSEEHKARVLKVADKLRNPWGIEADIDQYVRAKPPYTPAQGWDLWMEKRIEWAEFVLIVCTETYKRRFRGDEESKVGQGSTWEGTIIRQHLYNNQLATTKFIPVVFSRKDLDYIPLVFNSHDKYILDDEESFRELCYRLKQKPLISMSEVIVNDPGIQAADTIPSKVVSPEASFDFNLSNKGLYTFLLIALKNGDWKEADEQTWKQMGKIMGKMGQWLSAKDIENFPGDELHIIDQMWRKYSKEKFGFSIQSAIWQQYSDIKDPYQRWKKFGEVVGWRSKGFLGIGAEWKAYSELISDIDVDKAPRGYLPSFHRYDTQAKFSRLARKDLISRT